MVGAHRVASSHHKRPRGEKDDNASSVGTKLPFSGDVLPPWQGSASQVWSR